MKTAPSDSTSVGGGFLIPKGYAVKRELFSYSINYDTESKAVTIEQESPHHERNDMIVLHADQVEVFVKDLLDEIKG